MEDFLGFTLQIGGLGRSILFSNKNPVILYLMEHGNFAKWGDPTAPKLATWVHLLGLRMLSVCLQV